MLITIPYKPRYPEIHDALENARFSVLVAHRRFGKTVLAVNHLIRSCVRSGRPQARFGYVAPFRVQAKSVAWDYLKHYAQVIPGAKANESELSVSVPTMAGGEGRVRIFGADNPDALRGLYFDGVVLDEVAQMKPEVWEETIQPALADRRGYAIFIGTPKGVNLFSRLYYYALKEQAAAQNENRKPAWIALRYPCDRTNALAPEEIARLRNELSDNAFRQELLCDFTASADDVLIGIDEVRSALERKPVQEMAERYPLVIGCDIARFGSDATVFIPRRGPVAYAPLILRGKSNTDVAQRLTNIIAMHKPFMVNIDQGQGTGVIDMARDLNPHVRINEVPFGSQALEDNRYFNRRSEMWALMRDWIRDTGALPNSDAVLAENLMSDLSAPRYSYDAMGRIKLEPKDEIKKRLGRSTDIGDALALTFALPTPPVNARDYNRPRNYDPFHEGRSR